MIGEYSERCRTETSDKRSERQGGRERERVCVDSGGLGKESRDVSSSTKNTGTTKYWGESFRLSYYNFILLIHRSCRVPKIYM